ncbi:hypothetical protein FLSU104744_16035 [Flavobacterium succinicans]|jgi:hypothetical protein
MLYISNQKSLLKNQQSFYHLTLNLITLVSLFFFLFLFLLILIQQGLDTMWWYCGYGFLGSNHQIVGDFFVALVHDHGDHRAICILK